MHKIKKKKYHTEKRIYFQDAEDPLNTRRILFKDPYTKISWYEYFRLKKVNSCHTRECRYDRWRHASNSANALLCDV